MGPATFVAFRERKVDDADSTVARDDVAGKGQLFVVYAYFVESAA